MSRNESSLFQHGAARLLLVLALGLAPLCAQTPFEAWRDPLVFPGSGDIVRAQCDALGNVYVCSGTLTVGFFNTSVHWFQVAKYDAAGNRLWTFDYRPTGGFAERVSWLTVDSQGNVIATGYAQQTQASLKDVATIKLDPDGNVVWIKRFNGGVPVGNRGHRVATDANDDVYVLGTGGGFGGVVQVFKLDAGTGSMLWSQGWTPPGSASFPINARALAVTPGGNVAVTGAINSLSMFLRSYDATGAPQFGFVDTSWVTGGLDVVHDSVGNWLVSGAGLLAGTAKGLVAKYGPTGNLLWKSGFNSNVGGSTFWDTLSRLEVDPADDGVAAVGSASGIDWAIGRFDAAGNLQWNTTFDGFGLQTENATDLEIGPGGAIYVIGGAGGVAPSGGPFPSLDAVLVAYDSGGQQLWVHGVQNSGIPPTLARGRHGLYFSTSSDLVHVIEGIDVVVHQPGGPGSPVFVDHQGLTPGAVYHSLLSLEPCPGGPGTGPYLGLCTQNPQGLLTQFQAPLGTPVLHFLASAPTIRWGPFPALPVVIETVAFQLSPLGLVEVSPVDHVTIN
ncbi:MAG TPA: hypothetical protein ENK43_13855 [Planctomycetes bacterium]|nr:hypothetical protein [Planctomycetota bacterium]